MKRTRFCALAVVMLLLASACNLFPGDPDDEPEPPDVGGALRVAVTNPGTIDPSRSTSYAAHMVLQNICEPLVTADPATGELMPGAAESWTISDDARTITFRLKGGVAFHDGTEVKASDYVFSISRFVHSKTGSSRRFWFDRVSGYAAVASGTATTISGVTAPDEMTLVIKAARPFADLPAVLSHPGAGSAIPKASAEGAGFASRPGCTGPYQLMAPWDGKSDLRLVRANGYDGGNEAYSLGGRGFVDEIIFDVVGDLDEGYLLLDEGKVHVAEVPVTNRLVEAREVEGRVETGPSGTVSYIGFPTHKTPFGNANYRRALSAAIDRGRILTDMLADSRLAPEGMLPPSTGRASEESRCDLTRATPDIDAAKQSLADSKATAAEMKFDLHFNNEEDHSIWLTKVIEGWEEHLNVTASLKSKDLKSLLDDLTENKVVSPFRMQWVVEYPSPEAFLAPLFSSTSPDNFTRYRSEEFAAALSAARAERDDERRAALYADAADVLCQDAPIIVMWFGSRHIAFGEDVMSGSLTKVGSLGHPVLRELGLRA